MTRRALRERKLTKARERKGMDPKAAAVDAKNQVYQQLIFDDLAQNASSSVWSDFKKARVKARDSGKPLTTAQQVRFLEASTRPGEVAGRVSSQIYQQLKDEFVGQKAAEIREREEAAGRVMKAEELQRVSQPSEVEILELQAHADREAVENIFKQNPDARVLWAHSGFDPPGEVGKLLAKYKNLWADLAFRFEHAHGGQVDPVWEKLFLTFPDRIMVGTDTYTPERWYEVVVQATWNREWLKSLPKDVAEKIAYKNAVTLINLGDFQ